MAITKKPRGKDDAVKAFIEGGSAAPTPADDETPLPRHKKPAMLRFDPELLKRIDKAAAKRFQSRTAYVTAAIVRQLEDDER